MCCRRRRYIHDARGINHHLVNRIWPPPVCFLEMICILTVQRALAYLAHTQREFLFVPDLMSGI